MALALAAACHSSAPAPPLAHRNLYASAEDVELQFRGKTFVLGDNNEVAEVRAIGAPKDQFMRLPFWFGINVLVPGVTQPKEGDYYVISEAMLGKALGTDEWMIEAGSTLVKQEAVFDTTRTHYLGPGKILPTIVQYMGLRQFTTPEGKSVQIPILREVSLPMKWTLEGSIPASYARYRKE